eukprot:4936927-Pyramimonas_sp.AAC.1
MAIAPPLERPPLSRTTTSRTGATTPPGGSRTRGGRPLGKHGQRARLGSAANCRLSIFGRVPPGKTRVSPGKTRADD